MVDERVDRAYLENPDGPGEIPGGLELEGGVGVVEGEGSPGWGSRVSADGGDSNADGGGRRRTQGRDSSKDSKHFVHWK